MDFKTQFHPVGDGHPCYVIAEMGSNFEGSLDKAKMLVDLAAEVGAQAAKFQTFTAQTLVSPVSYQKKLAHQAEWKEGVFETYRRAEFPYEWHAEVHAHCKKRGLDFFTSVYNDEGIKLLEEIGVDLYKIGSGEINHPALLRKVAATGKPVLLATGASTQEEVDRAVEIVRKAGAGPLVLMQCVTAYPTPFGDANLRVLQTFKERYKCLVGYSDHTPGSVVPLGAVAMGACAIEKHFTWDKKRTGPDHPFAMDVEDMRVMVDSIRKLETAMGSPAKALYPSEAETVVGQRRSLHMARDMAAGSVLSHTDLLALRPALGVPPDQVEKVIGRQLARAKMQGEALLWDDLKAP